MGAAAETGAAMTTPYDLEDDLREVMLAYPGAVEDHPWEHTVAKVNGKIFVFLGAEDDSFGITVKLPLSAKTALKNKWAKPCGYGLGKHGWVSCVFKPDKGSGADAHFSAGAMPPMGLLKAWIDESYRAMAPKKLVAQLPAVEGAAAPAATKKPAVKKKAAKKAAKKPPAAAKKAGKKVPKKAAK
jgi:predicted DNA-binding protein (MmcQ/YjbR family)